MKKKEGIYFGMPDEEYHALPYVSRSMIDDILIDIEQAWHNSWMNPNKEEDNPTEAMQLGTAIHSAILEPDVFKNKYALSPRVEDYEGKEILKTTEDLANFLTKIGEKKTGKKDDLIERAMPWIDPNKHVIWDKMYKEFLKDVEEKQKRILSQSQAEIIEEIQKSLDRREALKELFIKGYPEVTIIWKDVETGIKCKCRIDYLRPDAILELKSFSVKGKKSIYKSCCDEIVYQKYNLQFLVYSKALETITKKIVDNQAEVFGEVDKEWLDLLLESKTRRFFILFVRTASPYQSMLIEMAKSEKDGGSENVYYTEPLYAFRKALRKYQNALKKFGVKRWVDEKYIRQLDDPNVPGVMYQFND